MTLKTIHQIYWGKKITEEESYQLPVITAREGHDRRTSIA